MKKPLHMVTGINLVDYGFDPDTFLPLVKRFKVGENYGGVFNYISVRLDQKKKLLEDSVTQIMVLGEVRLAALTIMLFLVVQRHISTF